MYDIVNERIKYFRLLKGKIQDNNLKIGLLELWYNYYDREPSYKYIIDNYDILMIQKDEKVFNECNKHLDDLIRGKDGKEEN